jgi:hypothetical protein
MFADFINIAKERGCSFVPLGEIVRGVKKEDIAIASIHEQIIPGREGWISVQRSIAPDAIRKEHIAGGPP